MSFKQVSLEAVLDGQSTFATAAVIGASLNVIRQQRGYESVHGHDDLDAYEAIPLIMRTEAREDVKLVLWWHAGSPADTFVIRVPLAVVGTPAVDRIIDDLGIPAYFVQWKASGTLQAVRPEQTALRA